MFIYLLLFGHRILQVAIFIQIMAIIIIGTRVIEYGT